MKHPLSKIMKENAYFDYYQDGLLHYSIHVPTADTLTSYRFTIDTTGGDLGHGRFKAVEKGIMLMRWFNKCVEDKTLIIDNNEAAIAEADGKTDTGTSTS
jgi:hypothetical protein